MKAFATSAALVALMVAPAFAQSSHSPVTTVTGAHSQLLSTMEAAGATKATTVNGKVYTAETSDGAPAFVVVVPKSFIGTMPDGKTAQSLLTKAGMKNVQSVNDSKLVKGVLAVSGVNFSSDKSGSDLKKSQFKDKLKSAGMNEESTFKGKLASAQTSDGKTVYMIIGDKDLTADGGNFNFADAKMRSAFDKAKLSNLRMLDDTQVVQAHKSNETFFVVTGKDLVKS